MFLRCRATGSVRIRVHTISMVSAASAAKKGGLQDRNKSGLGIPGEYRNARNLSP